MGMGETYKVAIVGSGPAGLSAAARAAKRGMTHVLLEKADHLSDTIYKYQRGKHIMATPNQLALRSDVAFDAGKREAILDIWNKQCQDYGLGVRLKGEVTAITGERGAFTLTLADRSEIQAEAVILAIGTQGNPNRVRFPGGDHPCVQYQLDDPGAHTDENIIVMGGGDAGIENALGLANPDLGNTVTLLQRGPDFSRAKSANVALLEEARAKGWLDYITEASPKSLEGGVMLVETRDGEVSLPCQRVIARLGSMPPRKFVESCGIAFTGPDAGAFPALSASFESTVPGIYVVGALAGYPLIKHCMNQGYDAIEHLAGNVNLKPADEPILAERLGPLPGEDVKAKLELLRSRVPLFADVSPLQMREFMLDARVHRFAKGERIMTRNDTGSSLFAIVDGDVDVLVDRNNPNIVVTLPKGQIFGEIGLISGRRRGATVNGGPSDAVVVEVPRAAALKLLATVPAAKRAIDRIAIERMLRNTFGADMPQVHLQAILDNAEIKTLKAGEILIQEGDVGYDLFIIRSGSLVVEKTIAGKKVFLSYVPAGAYVGEMSLFDEGRRNATVRAAVRTEAIILPGELFRALLAADPKVAKRVQDQTAARRELNGFVEAQKASYSSVVDMYTSIADFLIGQGMGEATDALLIDETLCIGCDNCETACAEAHDGISRLNREAGHTYAHLHVPTSCRHCENPHCMTDCPPNAITRAPDGEVFINDTCIGCGNCQRNCPYGVIQMAKTPPKKPGLLPWLLLGAGPGPGQAPDSWISKRTAKKKSEAVKVAVKCDMCKGIEGGASCVRACPTGAAMRVSPESYLRVSHMSDKAR
jgi:thioredoxin reductase/CRP-like cAMP-binding protein/Fe-S-cluster-containing hydrogenase component 2